MRSARSPAVHLVSRVIYIISRTPSSWPRQVCLYGLPAQPRFEIRTFFEGPVSNCDIQVVAVQLNLLHLDVLLAHSLALHRCNLSEDQQNRGVCMLWERRWHQEPVDHMVWATVLVDLVHKARFLSRNCQDLHPPPAAALALQNRFAQFVPVTGKAQSSISLLLLILSANTFTLQITLAMATVRSGQRQHIWQSPAEKQ